jgi:hypothetical protein
MIDCIAGYHMNPWSCGIAKFNAILARELGIPMVQLNDLDASGARRPLLSLKLSEFVPDDVAALDRWAAGRPGGYDLFLHAVDGSAAEGRLVAGAVRLYCGNRELAETLRATRPDAVELFAPGMLQTRQRIEPADVQVFTFGMAHKIRVGYYRKLQQLLEATGRTYAIHVSTALHEGTSFDESFVLRFEELQALFQGRVYFHGYLSDTGVYNQLMDCHILAAFFEKGLRANNTTVNAAMELGCAVITNLDEHSPDGLVHMTNVIDIARCDALPGDGTLAQIGTAARALAESRYGWDRLVAELLVPAPAVPARP